MPWATPTLRKVREIVRDDVTASLYGAVFIGNNVLRVMSDAMAGLAHHCLRYIDWLALQLLPDTAETEWLDRHGDIWLVNADGTVGRKMASYATGIVTFTSDFTGIIIPLGTQLQGVGSGTGINYETTVQSVSSSTVAVEVPVRAIDPGIAGNLNPGDSLGVSPPIINIHSAVTVVTLDGGTEIENDNDLRMRVLQRIRQPPQGGAAHDYVRWALAVPGCTRAWCAPIEMGIGTVTIRVMFDDLRADNDGFPLEQDLAAVTNYVDTVRPVAVKDFWVLAPLKQRVEAYINGLVQDTPEIRTAIGVSLEQMLFAMASPGQTIFAAWKYQAIYDTPGVVSFAMATPLDDIMESPGHLAVLGDIVYGS